MAKRYGTKEAAPGVETCAWPLCDATRGLVSWIRCFDFEVFEHCGVHHSIVGMLHRKLHPNEEE